MKTAVTLFLGSFVVLAGSSSFASSEYMGMSQEQLSKVGSSQNASMWGENFGVEVRRVKKEDMVFLLEFSAKPVNGRREAKVVDVLKVPLKKDQVLADGASFRCLEEQENVLAVINKKDAKEKSRFPAQTGWKLDTAAKKLSPVANMSKVSCDWFQNGDEAFPF